MHLLDHRKTWHFSIRATNEQCLQAFEQVMSHPGFKLLTARWGVKQGEISVVQGEPPWPASIATYEGRGGFMGVTTALMGGRARDEEQQAVGSQITFAVNPKGAEGRTECSMWLSKYGTYFAAFTPDARFLRSSMHDVEKQLRALDPALTVDKS